MITRLLCTFADESTYLEIVKNVENIFDLPNKKIYTFAADGTDTIYLMYNVIDIGYTFDGATTIIVHRKPNTNTVYTINAMNHLIRQLNGGVWVKNYMVDWNLFKNSLLLITNNELEIIPIQLKRVIHFN